MPLYEYKCGGCGYRFEELQVQIDDVPDVKCKKCGIVCTRQMSAFSAVIAGGSSNETVDMKIGREANNRWQQYTDNQGKRRGDKTLQSFDLPRASDGKFMPVMAVGEKKDVENRKEYVGALQEHRKERQQKGIPQFSEKGEF